MKQYKQYIIPEYKKISVSRPMVKKTTPSGNTKIIVGGKKIPISSYVNIGLGISFSFLMLKTFLPDLNPFVTIEDGVIATFSHIRGTAVTFDWATLTDPVKIQKAMKGTSGGFAVIDSNGELLAGVNETSQLHPASVSKLLTTAAAIEKYPLGQSQSVLNPKRIGALKEANAHSDNIYFENLGREIGIDYIQDTIRKITKNDTLTIGNGSGCNDYTTASAHSRCDGSSSTNRPTKISAIDIVKVVKYLDTTLAKSGMKLEDVTGSTVDGDSTVAGRYSGRLIHTVTGKTGSLPSKGIYALAGKMYGPDREVIYFATVTLGDKQAMIGRHIKVLNSVYPK